jgi:transposase
MVLVDGAGLPLGIHLAAAHLAEGTLAEATLAQVAVPRAGPGRPKQKPQRIVADKAYDSGPLYERLRQRGIQLIAPHRRGRRKGFQDGRSLRRYRRRWIIERTNSWLLSFRRLATRYEHRLERYRAFAHVACLMITLRWF